MNKISSKYVQKDHLNRKYRSQQPYLNKLDTIIGQKLQKITHNSIKRDVVPYFKEPCWGPRKEHPHRIWSKSLQLFKKRSRKSKKFMRMTTATEWLL